MKGFQELSEPIRGSYGDFPVIVLGVLGDTRLLCIDSDGRFQDLVISDVKVDFKFDLAKREWVDLDLFKSDE